MLLALLAFDLQAHADEPPASETTHRQRVIVRSNGPAESAERWTASFRELLGRLGIDVVDDGTTDRTPPPLAVVTVDLSHDGEVVVEVVDGKTGREQTRRTLKGDRASPLTLEAAAHVAQFAVEDLLETQASPPVAAPPPLTEPAEPAPPPETPAQAPAKVSAAESDLALDVGAFAVGRRFSDKGALALGGGAAIGPRLAHVPGLPTLWLSAAYHAPIEIDEGILRLRVSELSLRLTPTLEYSRPSWALEAGISGGADLLFSTTDSANIPTSYLAGRRTDASPVLGALVTCHVAVAKTAAVTLSLFADVDLSPRHYVGKIAGDEIPLLSSARVRPALALGFAFSTFGRSRFASAGGEGR